MDLLGRILLLIGLLFLFLVSIKLLSSGIKLLGADTAGGLFEGIKTPFAALSVGILGTVLVQSSSVTTSTIVALVGAGSIEVVDAVPMVLGANIGTTITNTLVSMGSISRKSDFRRAFAAATVHDFFNLIAVAIFLPLQLATGFLSDAAAWISRAFPVGEVDGEYNSPIKAAIKAVSKLVTGFVEGTLGLGGSSAGIAIIVIGLVAIFLSLTLITKTMRRVIAARAEKALNRALKKSGTFAIGIGATITMAVQSSSITTSLLVPLCAAGILTLENAFPVMLGANIGTTITAFLASLATDINGLQIALVHVLFNLLATLLVYPFASVRRIPIRLARGLAIRAVKQKVWVLAYVVIVFVLIPIAGVFLFR
jgi:solute carrier family 34 (sodium-dependent phosphate cotransporter)